MRLRVVIVRLRVAIVGLSGHSAIESGHSADDDRTWSANGLWFEWGFRERATL